MVYDYWYFLIWFNSYFQSELCKYIYTLLTWIGMDILDIFNSLSKIIDNNTFISKEINTNYKPIL